MTQRKRDAEIMSQLAKTYLALQLAMIQCEEEPENEVVELKVAEAENEARDALAVAQEMYL